MRTVLKVIIPLLLTLSLACTSAVDPDYILDGTVEKLPVEVLNSAPVNLTIDGMELSLKTDLWRDFMPISPPDGKPLIAHIEIRSDDQSALPEQLNADAVWVLYKNQVWGAELTETQSEDDPTRLVKVARDGPKFGPGKNATVVVRITYGDDTYLMRNSNQEIIQTS